MLFGRVRGTAISVMKYQGCEGLKLLLVQPLDRHLQPVGGVQVAVDVTQAGIGDLCVMVRSREASLALPEEKHLPIDLALVGVVDDLQLGSDDEFDFVLKPGRTCYS